MKKINRITLIVAALPVAVVTLLLILDFFQSTQSYKSLANWGKVNMGISETAYYDNRIKNIVTKWQKAGNKQGSDKGSNNTFLHIDLEKNAIWLEENEQVKDEDFTKLPENISWKLSSTGKSNIKDLSEQTILRLKRPNENFIGQFFLNGQGNHFIPIINASKSGMFSVPPPDVTSLIISEEEYEEYRNSLPQISSEQTSEKRNSKTIAIEENKSRWFDTEKYLYMEIDGQVCNVGYKLKSIYVEADSEYTNAFAIIEGQGKSKIFKYLHLNKFTQLCQFLHLGNTKTVRVYLEIDYLGNDIWYATTHPQKTLKSDKKIDLEFLIFPDKQIPRSQYRKYIKQGRRLRQTENITSSNSLKGD